MDDLTSVRSANMDFDWLLRDGYPDTFDFDIEDLLDVDGAILVSTISAICGAACGDMTANDDEKLNADRVELYQAVLDTGFNKLSDSGQDALAEIFDVLKEQLSDMASGSVNPFDISQYWTQQFSQYEDWQFARLARTESAFAQSTVKLSMWGARGVSDEAIVRANAIVPLHPNCKCENLPMAVGDKEYLYLDTSMEPCEICNDIAEEVLNIIDELASSDE